MLTIHSAPRDRPLFLGRLSQERRKGRPILCLTWFDPVARFSRTISLPDAFRLDGVVDALVSDPTHPDGRSPCFVGLDERDRKADEAALSWFRASLRRFLAERRAAGDLSPAPHYLNAGFGLPHCFDVPEPA